MGLVMDLKPNNVLTAIAIESTEQMVHMFGDLPGVFSAKISGHLGHLIGVVHVEPSASSDFVGFQLQKFLCLIGCHWG